MYKHNQFKTYLAMVSAPAEYFERVLGRIVEMFFGAALQGRLCPVRPWSKIPLLLGLSLPYFPLPGGRVSLSHYPVISSFPF